MEKVISCPNIERRWNEKKWFSQAGFLSIIIAFLLGRAVMFEIVSPFGLAFLAAYVDKHPNRGVRAVLLSVVALAGLWSGGVALLLVKYTLAFVLFGLIYLPVSSIFSKLHHLVTPVIAAVSLATSGIVFFAKTAFVPYDVLMLLVECGLCVSFALMLGRALPMVYAPGVPVQWQPQDMTAFYVMMAVAVLGFSGWTVGGVALGASLAGLFIMVVALAGGMAVSAAVGLGVGMVSSFAAFPMTEMLGIYGFCGLLSGMLSKHGRVGVAAGFVAANTLLSFYLGGFGGNVLTVPECLLAVCLFFVVPKPFVLELEVLLSRSGLEQNPAQKTLEVMNQRITGLSVDFRKLATVFSGIVGHRADDTAQTISHWYDQTADRVCCHCALRFSCWEKNFSVTQKALSKVAPVLMEAGKLDVDELPQEFTNQCIKAPLFVKELNKTYGKYRLGTMWQQQLQQSRELVSEHLRSVSDIIDGVATDLNLSTRSESQLMLEGSLEKRLAIELEKMGVKCSAVTVTEDSEGRLEVGVYGKDCGGVDRCAQQIVPLATQVLGRRMCKKEAGCARLKKHCTVRLVEQEQFEVAFGSACCPKEGHKKSGDSFGYQPVGRGKYAVILSDGMGSGDKAARESGAAIELMHYFLKAGFEKKTAVKMLNSTLLMRSEDECFATLDIVIIDLFTGVAEWTKSGANVSYIKRGNKVEEIEAHSLPAGILKSVDMQSKTRQLQDGDCVVLLSDGILSPGEDWLAQMLAQLTPAGPQHMAKQILEEAVRRKGCKEDDMTVLVCGIGKQEGVGT